MNPGAELSGDASSRAFRASLQGWAGLVGAAGVALAAVAAHRVESPALIAASTMLLIHAAASLALIIAGPSRRWLVAAAVMLFAASLFGIDVTLHTLAGHHLFPMAAPIGGSLLIASWLFVAVIGWVGVRRV